MSQQVALQKYQCGNHTATHVEVQRNCYNVVRFPPNNILHNFFCDSPLLHLILSGLQKVIQDNHALALYQLCRNQLIIPDLPSILCPISIITRTLNTNHHTLLHVFLNVSPKLIQRKYKYRGHKRCISNKSQVCVLAGVCRSLRVEEGKLRVTKRKYQLLHSHFLR